jgi:branched-chain amino acid transport system ATP-binding protein
MILEIKELFVSHGAIEVLKGIEVALDQNEIVSILGANGSGKSTLLKAVSGVIPIKKGKVFFNNQNIAGLSANKIVRLGISQVPEGRQIFSSLRVIQNLRLGAYSVRNKKREVLEKKLDFVYSLFPILKERTGQRAGKLSGGEQQMLAIGRALMAEPKLMLLDEPSIGLAPLIIQEIFNTIKFLKEEKKIPIILVEQNIEISLKISDRGYVLENGRIVLEGQARDLLKNEKVKQSYLGK